MRDEGQARGTPERHGLSRFTRPASVVPPLAGVIIALHPLEAFPFRERTRRRSVGREWVYPHGEHASSELRIVARYTRGTGRRRAGDREGGFACRHGRTGRSSGTTCRADKQFPSRRAARTIRPPSRRRTAGENGCCWRRPWSAWRSGDHFLVPWVETALNTVSTDDAYVNGHVTFVAPRVAGQVSQGPGGRQLPREEGGLAGPARQGAVPGSSRDQARPPWSAAEADLVAAKAQVRGAGGPGPGQSVQAPACHRGRQQPDRQSPRRRGDAQQQEGDPGAGEGQPQTRRGAGAQRGHQQGRARPAPADGQGR